jgi:hypothetical protein
MKRALRWMIRLSALVPLAAFAGVLVLWIPKRAFRWILHFLAIQSLLACVGAGALWVYGLCHFSEFQFIWVIKREGFEYVVLPPIGPPVEMDSLFRVVVEPMGGMIEVGAMVDRGDGLGSDKPSGRYHSGVYQGEAIYNPSEGSEALNLYKSNLQYDAVDLPGLRVFRPSGGTHGLIIRDWLIMALSAIGPVAWTTKFARRARRGPNACTVCGYDLRATPGRCPECGAVAAGSV